MSKLTLPRLRIAGFVLTIFVLITPVLTQTRSNGPNAIAVSGAIAAKAAKAQDQRLDITDYQKLLADDPGDVVAENNLGALYFASGRYDEALDLIRRAADAQPDMWNIQVNASIALAHQSAFAEALKYAEAADRLAPKELRVRQQLCDMYFAVRDGGAAVQCFAALVKDTSTETDPEDLLGYGEALIMTGDAARAEPALLRVVQVSPQMAPAHNALGMAQFKQNHYKDAVDSFREAIRLAPDESRYRFNMAIADMAMRNREGALSQYNLLKQSNPKLAGQLYNMMFADKVLVVGH